LGESDLGGCRAVIILHDSRISVGESKTSVGV
jgi:hypothetical protein